MVIEGLYEAFAQKQQCARMSMGADTIEADLARVNEDTAGELMLAREWSEKNVSLLQKQMR